MKINYTAAQQLIARILLISLLLQSCGGGFDNNPLISTQGEQIAPIRTNAQASIQPLVDQILTAQGKHMVTCYEEAGQLKADVKMNVPKGFSKTYAGLSVTVEQGAGLAGDILGGEEEAEEDEETAIPNECFCPITQEIMEDPVIAQDGYTYERSAIEHWFKMVKRTSFKTGVRVLSTELTPNHAIRSLIRDIKAGVNTSHQVSFPSQQDMRISDQHISTRLSSSSIGDHNATFSTFSSGYDLPELPPEIWENILSYVEYPEIITARGISHIFKELTKSKWLLHQHLCKAIVFGRIDKVSKLLHLGADISNKNDRGDSCLHLAVLNEQIEIVKLLLDKGADVNARNSEGLTPLHFCCTVENRELELAELLVDYGANPNIKGTLGTSAIDLALLSGHTKLARLIEDGAAIYALHDAIIKGNTDYIQALLNAGTDIEARNKEGNTPLYVAVEKGQLEVAKLLLDRKADIHARNREGNALLHVAVGENQIELIKLLLAKGADVNSRNTFQNTPLHWAVRHGNLEIVRLLLERGADVNVQGDDRISPLHIAVGDNQMEIMTLLLDHGADMNLKGKYNDLPLHWAAARGHSHIISRTLLLARSYTYKNLRLHKGYINSKDSRGETLLHKAARNGHLEVAKTLLEYEVDIEARNKHQNTPLHWAVRHGHLEIVALLLKRGAKVNARGYNNTTSLHIAAGENQMGTIKLLLEHKADINLADTDNTLPLHWAAYKGHLGVVKLLLEHEENTYPERYTDACRKNMGTARRLPKLKASINSKDSTSDTPLHKAARNGHLEVAKVLLEYGADVVAKNHKNLTPYQVARKASLLTILNTSPISKVDKKLKVDKKSKNDLGEFEVLPLELLQKVLYFVPYRKIGNVRLLNHTFYKLLTGYNRCGVTGVKNKPRHRSINTDAWAIKNEVNFSSLMPRAIPSFAFYQLIRRIKNLPQKFWPYLKSTNIQAVNLSRNKIDDQGVAGLVHALQGTRVHTVDLSENQIGDQGIKEFTKHLQGTCVHTLDLSKNNINDVGASQIAQHLKGSKVHTVSLRSNHQITTAGVVEFIRALQGTNIHTVNLKNNRVKLWAKKLLKEKYPHMMFYLD
jgi:ankyrin repeat protein